MEMYNKYFDNKNTKDGGIVVCVTNKFQVRKLIDLSVQQQYIESLFLEVTHPHFLIGMIYIRLPIETLHIFSYVLLK